MANIESGFARFEGESDSEYYARLDAALSGDDFDEEEFDGSEFDYRFDDIDDYPIDEYDEVDWDWPDDDFGLDDDLISA